jgi:hypothetical protein
MDLLTGPRLPITAAEKPRSGGHSANQTGRTTAHKSVDPGSDIYPAWTVERLDTRLGGCAGNYRLTPHQIKRGSRNLRFGNYDSFGVVIGEIDVCFPGGMAATFSDNRPLPPNVLENIGVGAASITAPN